MAINYLLKASEAMVVFKDLIGNEVTFKTDIICISGSLLHKKGEKACISDVVYSSGYYSRLGGWVDPKISAFQINNNAAQSWIPSTFIEYSK